MNCARCEIARAKIRVVWLFNCGSGADEIVFDLNARYAGTYFYVIEGDFLEVRRKPSAASPESALIASFRVAEPKLNNVF